MDIYKMSEVIAFIGDYYSDLIEKPLLKMFNAFDGFLNFCYIHVKFCLQGVTCFICRNFLCPWLISCNLPNVHLLFLSKEKNEFSREMSD